MSVTAAHLLVQPVVMTAHVEDLADLLLLTETAVPMSAADLRMIVDLALKMMVQLTQAPTFSSLVSTLVFSKKRFLVSLRNTVMLRSAKSCVILTLVNLVALVS